MDIRGLKRSAKEALSASTCSPTRLLLLHTGAALALSLLLTLIGYLLDLLAPEGGLRNMGTQSVLSTIQVVLELAYNVARRFWAAALIFAALGIARRQSVRSGFLLEGFRRFRPILSSVLLQGIQYFAVAFGSMYLSFSLLMITPFYAQTYETVMQFTENPTAPIDTLGKMLLACYFITYLMTFIVLSLPIFYRYRMVNYVIMDDPDIGGLRAMFVSRTILRRKRLQLLKLDLCFWWFYLLELAISVISLGNLILPALGVTLPFSDAAAGWIFPIVGMICQLVLYVWAKPKLAVTYALYYESLLHQEQAAPKAQPKPQKMPWKY